MASKRWLWEQYDRHVMADTLADSGTAADAGVVRVHGSRKALAVTSDCTPRYVQADPYEGGKQAVAEAWRNLTAVGADPIAITDNLNFGNPERPEIMGQIVRAIDGMAEACRRPGLPGRQRQRQPLQRDQWRGHSADPHRRRRRPDPRLCVQGQLRRAGSRRRPGADRRDPRRDGLQPVPARAVRPRGGAPPPVDLALERRTGDFVRGLIRAGEVKVVHDLSDGGLIAAAAEMAMAAGVGVTLNASSHPHAHYYLFGEDQARYLIATKDADALIAKAHAAGVHASPAGVAGGDVFASAAGLFSVPLAVLTAANEAWLPGFMG